MLDSLRIKNYAIIEDLEIKFSSGLNIITGETGAGKSIILGALGLILGDRADSKTFRRSDQKCVVEGIFLNPSADVRARLKAQDLDDGEEIILRREINTSGKSRAFVNDTPVKLTQLREICGFLVDLHQQFETIGLQQRSFQTQILDTYAGCEKQMAEYQKGFRQLSEMLRQLESAKANTARAIQERDYVEFQLKEFEEINLSSGDLQEIEEQFALLSRADQILESLSYGRHLLVQADHAMSNSIADLIHRLEGVSDVHPEINRFLERLESMRIETEELGRDFEQLASATEQDEQRLQELEEKLNVIRKMQVKHNAQSEDALLAVREDLQQRLDSMEQATNTTAKLEQDIETLTNRLAAIAGTITGRRQDAVEQLASEVHLILAQLNMEHAKLRIALESSEQLTIYGAEEVSFLFAPNKGSDFKPIRKIASGGELARLNLGIKSIIARKMALPSLIFDEIDTGVSGEVALKMGGILRGLADQHQVTVITHTPQIASRADKHFKVLKRHHKEETRTEIVALSGEECTVEIAKMLSGDPPSDAAIDNAKELINLN